MDLLIKGILASLNYFIFGPFIVKNTKLFDFEASKNYFFKENQHMQMKFKGSKLAAKIENRNVPILSSKSLQILHLKHIHFSQNSIQICIFK